MTIAPSTPLGPAVAAGPGHAAVSYVTALLPTREELLDRLEETLPTAHRRPTTLLVVGLLRRDDGWPTPASTLSAVTVLVARSLRGDDWLGGAGAAEFAVVLNGDESAAAVAAWRLASGIGRLGIPGLSAAAGIAALRTGLTSSEVLRRATVSLAAARRAGPTTVIRHREPV